MKTGPWVSIAIAMLLTCGHSAYAAPLLWTLNYARVGPATAVQQFLCQQTDGSPCSGSAQLLDTNWAVDYFSQSSVAYGTLRAQSSVVLSGDGLQGSPSTFTSIGGNANYRDAVSVSAEGFSGSGTQILTFRVTGASSQTSGQSGRAQFQRNLFNGNNDIASTVDYLPDAQGLVRVSIPFIFGESVEYQIRFYALSQLFQYLPNAYASADFYSTAQLVGLAITDAGGQHVTNFRLTADSGTDYSLVARQGAVPEPALAGLLISGLLLATLRHRKNR